MRKQKLFHLTSAKTLNAEEMKNVVEVEIDDNNRQTGSGDSGSGSGGSGSGYGGSSESKPNRVEACAGSSYGMACTWYTSDGMPQNGICIYNKWGLDKGELFCAKKDYRNEANTDKL